jgi:exopolyphosphatase/guanosine-5'-triphosphate,3'-diphosphate pyrophosphatase
VKVAAVDCGTNSLRLLIVERGARGLLTLDRRMVITRLGQDIDATGHFHADALTRSLEVLVAFGDAIRAAGCERVRMTATSAARDASNFDDFREPAAAAIGVEPEVISGTDEAALTFLGAAHDLAPDKGPYLVVDIGGGSTEFVLGDAGTPARASISIDMGCVRVTEKFLHHDPPSPEELAEALAFVEDHLVDVEAAVPVDDARRLVGVAGTVTTLAAVALGLDTYDPARTHHHALTRNNVEALFRRLACETVAEHREDPAIEPARADVITAGTLILAAVMRRWKAESILVSEADILDGIARSLLDE